jgi:hypothetical protein
LDEVDESAAGSLNLFNARHRFAGAACALRAQAASLSLFWLA